MDGMEILRHIRSRHMPASVVVITAHGSVALAVEAMRQGAFDFIIKPFPRDRLLVTVRNALERERLTRTVDVIERDFARDRFQGFVGASVPMLSVYRAIESAAPSRASIFITGESGTGKELCAQAVHALSPRRAKPLIAINCAAIPRDLMESEIFGHVKGAFTGATADREGAAKLADGGTLFLDELGEMDLQLQSKLLRFVQSGTFQKVGGTKQEKVDVRFICATNRDPMKAVESGQLREDLFYRLHVVPIHLPPLREREGDAALIAKFLLPEISAEEGKDFVSLGHDAESAISAHDWPGNVRQLENILRQAVVLHDGTELTAAMLRLSAAVRSPTQEVAAQAAPSGAEHNGIRPLWEVERDTIEAAITATKGNIGEAARALGINASTIYRKRQSWMKAPGPPLTPSPPMSEAEPPAR